MQPCIERDPSSLSRPWSWTDPYYQELPATAMLFRRRCNFWLGFLMHQLPLVTGLLGCLFGKRNIHSKGVTTCLPYYFRMCHCSSCRTGKCRAHATTYHGQSNIDHALKGTHPLTQDAFVARQTWHDFSTDFLAKQLGFIIMAANAYC